MTKVVPNRALRLNGKDVPAGKPVEAPDDVAGTWIRNGWADDPDAVKAEKAKREEKGKDETPERNNTENPENGKHPRSSREGQH